MIVMIVEVGVTPAGCTAYRPIKPLPVTLPPALSPRERMRRQILIALSFPCEIPRVSMTFTE